MSVRLANRDYSLPVSEETGYSLSLNGKDNWRKYFSLLDRYNSGEVQHLRRRFVHKYGDVWEVYVHLRDRSFIPEIETFIVCRDPKVKNAFKQVHNETMHSLTELTHYI